MVVRGKIEGRSERRMLAPGMPVYDCEAQLKAAVKRLPWRIAMYTTQPSRSSFYTRGNQQAVADCGEGTAKCAFSTLR